MEVKIRLFENEENNRIASTVPVESRVEVDKCVEKLVSVVTEDGDSGPLTCEVLRNG